MFYDFAILVPAATAEADLIKYTLKLTYGIITHVYVEFPAGCRGYVYCTIDWEGHQLYPTNPDGAFNTEDYIIPIEDRFPLVIQPYQLYAKVWAPETTYDHTVTVRIEILEPDLLYPEAKLPASLEKVITFLGGIPTPPPEEEEVPPTPAPPPEEVPPPPPPEEVPPPPPPEVPEVPVVPVTTGMITLYATGLNPYSDTVWPTEWTVYWYYAAQNKWLAKRADYRGVLDTPWRAITDPITPPEPIDLNQLRFRLETFSQYDKCPMTGFFGYCNWKEFGPFVVEDGKEYEVNPVTKEFYER